MKSFNEVLPVIISILVILLVAALQRFSKPLAAITVTMPVNTTLSLWIVYSYNQENQRAMSQFTQGLVLGIVPTVAFILVVWLASRAGLKLVPILLVGYLTWVGVLVILLGVKRAVGL